jgi:hypothetical protein
LSSLKITRSGGASRSARLAAARRHAAELADEIQRERPGSDPLLQTHVMVLAGVVALLASVVEELELEASLPPARVR